jgi:Protein of unknown function (DUF1638)
VSHRHQESQANQQSQVIQAVVIACGALGGPIRDIAGRRGWPIELHCLPALLHNRPAAIAPQVERLAVAAQARGLPVAIGYADCGTYGALDELSARLGLRRLPGLHCYDLLAGPDRVAALFEAEPGTYVLTDFLVRSFRRTVLAGLGLDRYPELWPDYFGHYRRLVWLAQSRDPALDAEAEAVAARFGLPLTVIDTGLSRLERELEHLLAGVAPGTPSSCAQTAVGPVPGPDQPRPCAETAVAPVPPQDQRRPCAQTAAVTTDSAHATLPLAPGHSAAPGMSAETAALTTDSAHATQPPAPGHSAPLGMSAETAAITTVSAHATQPLAPSHSASLADADSPSAPLPPPATSTPPGVGSGGVINRLVLPGQHQSVDHERRPAAATIPDTPRVTAAPQASEIPGAGAESGPGMTGPGPGMSLGAGAAGPGPGMSLRAGAAGPGAGMSLGAEVTGPGLGVTGPGMTLGAGAAGARAAKGTGRCAGAC